MDITKNALRILFVTAEISPFSKVGGLADVAGALPKSLRELGHDVRVITPRYGSIDPANYPQEPVLTDFSVPLPGRSEPAALLESQLPGDVPVYMVESKRYFDREAIYGYPDDGERYVFFCRAVLEGIKQLGWKPDIVHANDWHTALIPNLLKTSYEDDPFYADVTTVFTIHNLAYQGIFDQRVLAMTGMGGGFLRPQIGERSDLVDLMSQGILYADVITTVSPTYAKEILTPEYGEGLDAILKYRKARIYGIINGLDVETFDPATDPHLVANYDSDRLERKLENKLALQQEGNLTEDPAIPLIGIVSRLADQKGFDLLEPILEPLIKETGAQVAVLGTGDQHYHDFFRQLGERYPQQTAIALTFDVALAQRIYAGADIFLMPSRYEPCGLGQLIAMRYGTVPVVRRTGGLADTVKDFDPVTGQGNGFLFEHYTSYASFVAILRAIEAFRRPEDWRQLQLNGMLADLSWTSSAKKYEKLYRKAQGFRVTG